MRVRLDSGSFTASTFSDFPDYYAADKDFKEVRRVTDVNPRVREFNWGQAELVHYKSADGLPLKGVLVKPEDFASAVETDATMSAEERQR